MGKRTHIIFINELTINEKRFNVDFCHDGGEGYRLYVTPYASNTEVGDNPYGDSMLQLTGSGSSPGMAHARLLNCSRPSKAKTAELRPEAIAKITKMVTDMLKAYGQEVSIADVLKKVEQAAEAVSV